MSALSSAYHGSPLGATVIPIGSLPLIRLASVMTPAGMIRATLPATDCVNQTEPSGAAAMPSGPGVPASGNGVTSPVAGSRKPPV